MLCPADSIPRRTQEQECCSRPGSGFEEAARSTFEGLAEHKKRKRRGSWVEPEPNIETPLQCVSGAMPVGTRQRGGAVTSGEWGDRAAGTRSHTLSSSPSELHAIRGSEPSKRGSVDGAPKKPRFPKGPGFRVLPMRWRCHFTDFASVMPCPPARLLPSPFPSPPPPCSLSLSRGRVCRERSTIGRGHGRTVIAGVCAPGLVPVALSFQGFLGTHRHCRSDTGEGRKGDKAPALHSIRRPLLGHIDAVWVVRPLPLTNRQNSIMTQLQFCFRKLVGC